MAISNAQQVKELWPGLRAILGKDYNRYPAYWTQYYEQETSDKAFEEILMIKLLGLATKKGEQMPHQPDDGAGEVYTRRVQHDVWQVSFAITEEAMEDNQYENIGKRYTKAAARSMAYTKDLNALVPLETGHTTYTTGDAVTLFNTAHPLGSFTNKNKPTTGGDPNETYLEGIYTDMATWVDARGFKINAQPRKIMAPPTYRMTLERLLETEKRVGTANNDINAIRSTGLIPEGYFINALCTDTAAWYTFSDIASGRLTCFQRRKLSTKEEYDFNTGNYKWKATERYVMAALDPLAVYGCKVGS